MACTVLLHGKCQYKRKALAISNGALTLLKKLPMLRAMTHLQYLVVKVEYDVEDVFG